MKFFVLGVILCFIPLAFSLFFGEHACVVSLRGFLTPGEHDEVTVPRDCRNGTLRWNYPMEYAIVHFSPNTQSKFSVCIGTSVYKFEIIDITGGTRQPISYGTCLGSLNNKVSIEIHASQTLFYQWNIRYYIDIKETLEAIPPNVDKVNINTATTTDENNTITTENNATATEYNITTTATTTTTYTIN